MLNRVNREELVREIGKIAIVYILIDFRMYEYPYAFVYHLSLISRQMLIHFNFSISAGDGKKPSPKLKGYILLGVLRLALVYAKDYLVGNSIKVIK